MVFSEAEDKLLSSPSVKAEYDALKPEYDKIRQDISWHDGATCNLCISYVFCSGLDWPDMCNESGNLVECDPGEAVSCHRFKEKQ